ncbi:polysaccharide pyruvyl transferase family protein [Leptolyngbyaceae cyanobacterium CCMR0081]|uniref:Polysaccharide pyruvyl transferase family protein n=2 Tax=Adonisia TaxID=2950183 RepID=A0A6M0RR36_9CYAN|nr:polysaccharide pyruvyl transferase family protein [Adonisia turfae CCMR0081]
MMFTLKSMPTLKEQSKKNHDLDKQDIHIFYEARTQYGNLGDLIINKTLLERLRGYGQVVINDHGVPDWYCQELGVELDERASFYENGFNRLIIKSKLKSLFQLKSSKTYLFLGPGHLSDNSRYLGSRKWILYFLLLRILGVRLCRLGFSIGELSDHNQKIVKWVSRFSYFYGVRDSISESLAHQMKMCQIQHFPDLAWLFRSGFQTAIKPSMDREYIVFSFRESAHSCDTSNAYQENLIIVLDRVVDLVCRQWSKRLVVAYQVDRDSDFCQRLVQRYVEPYDVEFVDQKLNVQAALELYSNALMVFSNRLHVLLFTIMAGSLPLAVIDSNSQSKVTGIFLDAELASLVLDIHSDSDQVMKLNILVDEMNPIKEKIERYRENRELLGQNLLAKMMAG